MINPFISIDEQLHRQGWNMYYCNKTGFRYVKKVGVDVFFFADFNTEGVKFFNDPIEENNPIFVEEEVINLFAAKMKEWRRQYERNTQTGRHYCKKHR